MFSKLSYNVGQLVKNSRPIPIDSKLSSRFFTPHEKPILPIFLALQARATAEFNTAKIKNPLSKTLIYYHHHALRNSAPLVKAMFELGAKPEHVYVLDKHYLTMQLTDLPTTCSS